jgi:hypothetical protein
MKLPRRKFLHLAAGAAAAPVAKILAWFSQFKATRYDYGSPPIAEVLVAIEAL